MAVKKGGLGKGLDLIFMGNETGDSNSTVTLKISEIEPNRNQPRQEFNEESLRELADSIAQHGVLQPLLVRPLADGGYQLVAGERRWRACRMAGVMEAPVIIREMSDSEMMQLSMIENLQRENLNPVEEGMGYRVLAEEYGFTQEEIAKSVGKSRPVIANAMRLLKLPQPVLDMVASGEISTGHARALLAFEDEEMLIKTANSIKSNDLTVRDVEKAAKRVNQAKSEFSEPVHSRDSFFDEVEIALKEHLHRKVRVKTNGENGGTLEIEFYNEDDLGDLARVFDTM